LFAVPHRSFDFGCSRDDAARNSHRSLEHRHRGDVRAGHLVYEAVSIGVRIDTKALGGLNPVMLVERIVGELADGDHVAGLVPRPDDQRGPVERSWRYDTHSGQPFYLAGIPGSIT